MMARETDQGSRIWPPAARRTSVRFEPWAKVEEVVQPSRPASPGSAEQEEEEEETSSVMASTTAEPMMTRMRKRGRPRGSSGMSKRKLPPPLKGKKRRKGNSQLNCVHSIHEFESAPLNDVVQFEKPVSSVGSHSYQELASMQDEACMLNLQMSNAKLANTEVPMPEPPFYDSFAKMTFVWAYITTLHIFCVMPQRPHFIPLEQVEEDSREGIALSYMMKFARLANSVQSLDLGDSINVLMKKLGALDDLEQHGFDVQILKLRLEDLIQVKRNYEDLMRKQAQVGTEAERKEAELGKINADLNVNEQCLRKLEDEIAVTRSRRAAALEAIDECQSVMSKLKMEFQEHQKKTDELKSDFSKIAMKPW